LLAEDVAQPQLYEDSWLTHQEVALTELVNEIFEASGPRPEAWIVAKKSLREPLIDIYHQSSVTTLYKRLQASLLYGFLSRPKDVVRLPEPANDLGLRKRFLSLLLDTYEESALRTAAEVVVGRQLPQKASSPPDGLEASEKLLDPAKTRRSLIGFLETFFVLVEDIDDLEEDVHEMQDASGRRWRKMILRSLMLIWLLDRSKACGAVSGCLIQRNSSLKTSAAVLQALSSMLIPTVGDIMRGLRHLEYTVDYVQHPLDEVIYRIKNMAVDFRDGVFLARLVEHLLFSSTNGTEHTNADATVAIALPDATVLESALYQTDGSNWPRVLSQHLKIPCLGRAQKLHNVQVTLSAMSGHAGPAGESDHDITADDIVDGHREKTLALLWSLVSIHGLAHLVDWNELIADVQQVNGEKTVVVDGTGSQSGREHLLQVWAAAHGERHGVWIDNLTTAFADQKAYTAILDDYQDYYLQVAIPSTQSARLQGSRLATCLQSLGCSAAFVRQFSASYAIPSRTTTISNLAFLASRLLPLARRNRAAVCIQQCFRKQQLRIAVSRRISLMRVAHACATVVQARNRIASAAIVLQRAWRLVLDGRIARLNADVQGFQDVARAWMVRRTMARAKSSGLHSSQSLRTMGGW